MLSLQLPNLAMQPLHQLVPIRQRALEFVDICFATAETDIVVSSVGSFA